MLVWRIQKCPENGHEMKSRFDPWMMLYKVSTSYRQVLLGFIWSWCKDEALENKKLLKNAFSNAIFFRPILDNVLQFSTSFVKAIIYA